MHPTANVAITAAGGWNLDKEMGIWVSIFDKLNTPIYLYPILSKIKESPNRFVLK